MDKEKNNIHIKICGLTSPREAGWLNEAKVDYAGFVFFEKSRRNVSLERARQIMAELSADIRRVAVTVSPTAAFVREITDKGFDILQVHGILTEEVLSAVELPVWYACNITDETQFEKQCTFLEKLPKEVSVKIEALVVDGAEYGSGRPFDWSRTKRLKKAGTNSPPEILRSRRFVLAGGLNSGNVAEGIRTFSPDIVDVSSGVEGTEGKDEALIREFVRVVRGSEANYE